MDARAAGGIPLGSCRFPWTARPYSLIALAATLLLAASGAAHAAPGDLDPAFDGDGMVTTDLVADGQDVANAVVVQTDGQIVVAGSSPAGGGGSNFTVARYNPDGSLDASFGGGGFVTTDFGGNEHASDLLIQPDGKIVVAGTTFPLAGGSGDFALARYSPDGSLDATFDGDGKVTTDLDGASDVGLAVLRQTDGKIVVAGGSIPAGGAGSNDFALARYDADGSLDPTFDGDGWVTTDFGGNQDNANDLVLQADGKLVAVGPSFAFGFPPAPGAGDFGLARYNADGSLDPGFGGDGRVTTDFGDQEHAFAAALQPDGKIVAAGMTFTPGTLAPPGAFALARYDADGSLDPGFDGDGMVTTDFSGGTESANGVVLQADGKIVAAGTVFPEGGGPESFGLARYNADGSLDAGFGSSGKVTTDFGDGSDHASDLVVQADGKIVVAGATFPGGAFGLGSADFALARYLGDVTAPPGGEVVIGFAGPGETVSTGEEATPADPAETSVTTPNAGAVSILEEPAAGPPAAGFTSLGWQVAITAPAASAADPLVIAFRLDASIVPPGEDETTVQVFKDGVPVPDCTGAPGTAEPDPCVASRELLADGDVRLTILTSAASVWTFGVPTDEGVPEPFVAFDPTVEITFGPLVADDKLEAKGTFTLGAGSDGIDPPTEDVTLQVGTYSTALPAGSFAQPEPGVYTFEGVGLEVVIQASGDGSYTFKWEHESAELAGAANPVDVELTIGDDTGSATVDAEIKP